MSKKGEQKCPPKKSINNYLIQGNLGKLTFCVYSSKSFKVSTTLGKSNTSINSSIF